MNYHLGAHTSIEGGVSNAVDLAVKLKFNTMQIFTKNNNRWFAKPLTISEIVNYKNKLSKSNIDPVIAHDCYLINLCASDKTVLDKSRKAFIDELIRCEQLGIQYLNFHPGSHLGQGEKEGIKLIAESINIAHSVTKNLSVFLQSIEQFPLNYLWHSLGQIVAKNFKIIL